MPVSLTTIHCENGWEHQALPETAAESDEIMDNQGKYQEHYIAFTPFFKCYNLLLGCINILWSLALI